LAYPTNDITTVHLDSPADSVGQARAELYNALVRLGELIDSRNTADGLAPLDSNSQIPSLNMPTTLTSGGSENITLQPATNVVVIEDVVKLTAITTATLANTLNTAGSIAYCSDGDAGSDCLAVGLGETDTDGNYIWYRVALGTQISSS
jgi:hypothetical protein